MTETTEITQKQRIIQMFEGGKTGYQIAKEIKRPTDYVYRVLKIYRMEAAYKESLKK